MKFYSRLTALFCLVSGLSSLAAADTKKVAGKYLCYQEHRIYYEVRGSASKTLIFIHGWAGSLETWKYQLDSFPDYKVIAIDLPGNGRSSKNEKSSYTMELFAGSIYQVLKQEKIDQGFLIGHSMGFAVCEVIVQKYPEICAGICSMDGSHTRRSEGKGRMDSI